MEREMNLVRELLMQMEKHPHGHAPHTLGVECYSKEQIGYHLFLMKQARLIDGSDVTSHGDSSPQVIAYCMTWEGHEFLANSKDEPTWRRATASVLARTGAVGFELLKAVLIAEAKKQMGLP